MRETDARQLAQAIQCDFPHVAPTTGLPWDARPPVKVIDCVLSLNRKYNAVVLPRVQEFADRFGDVRSCTELRQLADRYPSPAKFMEEVLRTRDARRAETLLGVQDFVIDVQQRFEGATEDERLRKWAIWARPGDYLAVDVRGFGLAGFQYLRMLFGAQTTKPDVHIVSYVSRVLGRKVSNEQALYTLERAAELAELPVRSLDGANRPGLAAPAPSCRHRRRGRAHPPARRRCSPHRCTAPTRPTDRRRAQVPDMDDHAPA